MLQKELGEIFRQQTAKMGNTLVSVSAVRISPDLSIAKVYLSIFPPEKSKEILENIKRQTKTVRYDLAQQVKETPAQVPRPAVLPRRFSGLCREHRPPA